MYDAVSIYESRRGELGRNDSAALEECLTYIAERKAELKLLFSENAENYLAGVAMEIINKQLTKNSSLLPRGLCGKYAS